MLIRSGVLAEIAAGRVTLAFRRWRRPTVRAGGTLRTAAGVLAIDAVDVTDPAAISGDDAQRAGYDTLEALLADLARHSEGVTYRIELRLAGDDPRAALRETPPSPEEIEDLRARLERFDRASTTGAWTATTLEAIASHPGVRAADLAATAGLDVPRFKRNVRKLKELGLTESLGIGYRLSPCGEVLLRALG